VADSYSANPKPCYTTIPDATTPSATCLLPTNHTIHQANRDLDKPFHIRALSGRG
jgi:hypothetical protein